MILLPAYGRDYTSKAKVLADFYANRDFVARQWGKPDRYVSYQQLPVGMTLEFRYKKATMVFLHAVEDKV